MSSDSRAQRAGGTGTLTARYGMVCTEAGRPQSTLLGAEDLLRDDKLQPRVVPAVVLRKSLRTLGALCIGSLGGDGRMTGAAKRAIRAECDADGKWAFSSMCYVKLDRRRSKLETERRDA